MNPVFFSKKLPPVKKVFLSSSGNFNWTALSFASSSLKKRNSQRSHQACPRENGGGNLRHLSQSSYLQQALVICDKRFQSSSLLKKWKENKNLKFYYVKSGEQTKSLEQLSQHIQKINSLIPDFDKNSLLFIAVGGGSVIDLTGFLASIYKRGLPTVFIPSTWLSALDSAHGGKNALNFKNIKNLLGTYHFPQAVFIVEELLRQNSKQLKQSAYGELLKLAFIKGGSFYKNLQRCFLNSENRDSSFPLALSFDRKRSSYKIGKPQKNFQDAKKVSPAVFIQQFLQPAIESKLEIVKKDPFETKGERKKLNLGHTVGHILESVESLPHGWAVLGGLLFSLNWSYYKGFLSQKHFDEMNRLIFFNNPDLGFTGFYGDSRPCFHEGRLSRGNDGLKRNGLFFEEREKVYEKESLKRKMKKRSKKSNQKRKKIPLKLFKSYLRQDKKHKTGFKIDFIFIKKPGEVFIKSVLETELIQEAKRQFLL